MNKGPGNNEFNEDPNNFGLPEDYFEKSAHAIKNKIEWIEEHNIYAQLSTLKKVTGFVIPQNYFEKSELNLELISYPGLLKIKKEPGFIAPLNYFENAETTELAKVFIPTENELSGFDNLNLLKPGLQNPFIVPENYFALSEQKIISNLTTQAKVIKLFTPKIWFSAAAAVLTIVLGLWLYNNFFKPVNTKDCGSLACLDKNDLVKSKNLENLDNDELYELVNTKKLEEKLEKKSDNKNKDKNADTSLKNINTEDLLDEI